MTHPSPPGAHVQSDKTVDEDLLNSGKGKAAKRGQMGRALNPDELKFKGGLSYEAEGDEEPDVDKFAGDIDDFLIVDNFGTRDERYGKKVNSGVSTKEFNKVFKDLQAKSKRSARCANAAKQKHSVPFITAASRLSQLQGRRLDRANPAWHARPAHGGGQVFRAEPDVPEGCQEDIRPNDAAWRRLYRREVRRPPVGAREGEARAVLAIRMTFTKASGSPRTRTRPRAP